MISEIKESQKLYPDEPETRVKKTIYITLTKIFKDILRES